MITKNTISSFAVGILVLFCLFLLGDLIYLANKPTPTPKPIEIKKIEYRDSPKVDSLKDRIAELEKPIPVKKEILYKEIQLIKDSIIRDTVRILASDIIQAQDSIICLKDSIIFQLTTDLKNTRDTAFYFQSLYVAEKGKKKIWRRVGIVSIILNGLLAFK